MFASILVMNGIYTKITSYMSQQVVPTAYSFAIVFYFLDLTINIMLPLGGVLIVIFAGWVMCRNSTADELGGAGVIYKLWRVLARYVAPIGILFIFLKAVGLLPDLS